MSAVQQPTINAGTEFDSALTAGERKLILEEQTILAAVLGELISLAPPGESPNFNEDILELRDSLGEASQDDVAQIVAQMDSLTLLSSHLHAEDYERPFDFESPYFGHLRVNQHGRELNVLIGNRSHVSGKSGFPIIDWRNAPISKLFYVYGEGEEYEEELGGRLVEGQVLAHRRLMILKGRLMRIECQQGTFQLSNNCWLKYVREAPRLEGGQRSALRPGTVKSLQLGVAPDHLEREDRHLAAITSLIDRAQFELITAPESGIVVIDGGAGSGKTTIALHRIAYLHFQDPRRFAPQAIMGLVFNKALASYISGLLPALGMDGVRIQVFENFASSLRRRHFPKVKGAYSQVTPYTVVRFKQHPASMALLEELIAETSADVRRSIAAALAGTKSEHKAMRAWDSLREVPLASRLLQYSHWVAGKIILPEIGAFGGDWLAQGRLRELLRERLPKRNQPENLAVNLWEEAFIRLERLEEALPRLAPGEFSSGQIAEIRDWCLEAYSRREEYAAVQEPGAGALLAEEDAEAQRPAPPELDQEDDTLLLLLYQQLVGALCNRKKRPIKFRHLMIDEAQDFSPLEVRLMISLADMPRSVTLAGDTDQRMILHNSFDTWEDVLRNIGLEGTAISPLRVGYRSTEEIMNFSKSVLGPVATDRPWHAVRAGAPVNLLRFTDQGQAVSVLAEALQGLLRREPDAYVALIARYPGQADTYFAGLEVTDLPRLRRVAQQDFTFQRGIDVTDVQQIKGLEFDYVIMLDVDRYSYPDDTASRYLLHIGATRAAHQLWLVACTQPSPLLPPGLTQQIV
ncbi:MAG: AAA family ATPase [SAR324 cluster bacterium]|nr:AAA family ATPase [SAR324 cluster bacterium]